MLITSGSGQAIDLINQVLLEPGDTVILEEFTYGGYLTKLRRIGVNIVGAPLDEDGIRVDALGQILADLKAKGTTPKYICTVPTIQNPTGSIMPLDRRREFLAVAAEYGVPIFEDECYADLTWGGMDAPPALYSLDPSRVIHIGSFSKTLAPALRLGYVVADWEFMSRMVAIKSAGDSGTGALEQMVVAEYFSKHFQSHVDELSAQLKDKLDTMVEAVEREFGTAVEPWLPKGGIFLWMKLPDQVDVRKLVQPALAAGIAFNPGPEWAVDGEAVEIAAAPVLRADDKGGDPRGRRRLRAGLLRAVRHPRAERQRAARSRLARYDHRIPARAPRRTCPGTHGACHLAFELRNDASRLSPGLRSDQRHERNAMTDRAEAQAQIDAALRRAVEAGEVPGVVAMAATADGPLYEGAFGSRAMSATARR